MKTWLLLMSLTLCAPALASEPSEASLKELLEITNSKSLLEGAMGQMDSIMKASMDQALNGQEVTPEFERVMAKMRTRMVALLQEEMSWDVLEPMFLGIYRKTLTQAEVDGMLAFYKSEAGRALIAKMPIVVQHSMQMMQQRMQALMPRLQALEQEMLREIEGERGR